MRRNKYPLILQECLEKHLLYGESLEDIAAEYPQWGNRLSVDLKAAIYLNNQTNLFNPRAGFISSSKKYLLEKIACGSNTHIIENRRIPSMRLLLPRLLLPFLVVVVILFSGTGVIFAAQSSFPGDSLFPIKTAVEGIRLALTFDEVKDAELHLQYAQDYMVACATLISQERQHDAAEAVQLYEYHVTRTARLLLEQSTQNPVVFSYLLMDFNNRLLQDLETFHILLPGEF